MTKGKRALSLVLSILALTMTACDSEYTYPDAEWKDHQIVTVGGKQYKYDEVYQLFEGTKSSAQAYFNVAKSVLAQTVTTRTNAILSTIDTQMEALHDTWKTNARTNGTTYKEEQEKTFDSEGVEDEDELKEKYIAQEQVSQNESSFKTVKNGTTNTEESYYLSEKLTKQYVSENAPYHVSHILVKVDASSSGEGYYNGQISKDDAEQISNVVRMLSQGQSFGSVAQLASDDSSNTQYGELYTHNSMIAMQKDTSYVNEFKLGVYAYDTFLNPETKADKAGNTSNDQIRAQLRVPGKEITTGDYTYDNKTAVADEISSTPVANGKAFGIPLSVAFTLMKVADMTTNPEDGSAVTYATATQYPRNIYFNNYFNYHGVNFIYDDSAEYDAKFLAEAQQVCDLKYGVSHYTLTKPEDLNSIEGMEWKYKEYKYVKDQLDNIDDDAFKTYDGTLVGYTSDATITKKTQTTTLSDLGAGKKILVDMNNNNNPIIVTRAGTSGDSGYQGLHFITLNSDPFVNEATKYEYYRVNIPTETAAKDSANSNDYKTNPSFINYVKADSNSKTTYNERRETVEKAIENSLDNFSFTLYDENCAKYKEMYGTDFSDLLPENVATLINTYKNYTESSTKDSANDSLDSSWETYVRQLNLQEEFATMRMIPTLGVAAFESGSYNETTEAICHVQEK